MYQRFYNLRMLPFENTPDPRLFFAAEAHREALAAIEYTIRLRKGPVLVTGPVGAGKTTVARAVARRCEGSARIAALTPAAGATPQQVTRQVLRALEVEHREADDHALLLERLEEHLHEQSLDRRAVVLMVDEAQRLDHAGLEELRLISDLGDDAARWVQLVLVGQPELRETLGERRGAALRQRLFMARSIEALSHRETADYIAHRIAGASHDPDHPAVSFDDHALAVVHEHAGGLPRLINTLCDNALLLAFTRQQRVVGADTVQHVQRDMLPDLNQPQPQPQAAPRPRLALSGS